MLQRGPLIFLAVILAALLPFLLQIAWPFLTAFILASILAIVMNPIKNWLTVRIHRPGVATFLTTSATVFVLGIILAFAGFVLTQELTAAYEALSRRSLEEGGWPTRSSTSCHTPPACTAATCCNPSMAMTVFSSAQQWTDPGQGVQLFGTCQQTSVSLADEAERSYANRFQGYASWKRSLEDSDLARQYRFYLFRVSGLKILEERAFGDALFVQASIH